MSTHSLDRPARPGVANLSFQPAKGLYIIFELLRSLLIYPPFLYLYFAVVGTPKKSWSIGDTLKIYRAWTLGYIIGRCRIPVFVLDPSKPVDDSKLKQSSFVSIPAPRSALIKDVAANDRAKPLPSIAGYAFPRNVKLGEPKGQVCLYFHGGAYYVLNASEKAPTSAIPIGCLKHTSIGSVLSVEYRTTAFAPFPGQLVDGLAGYAYLVETLKIDPSRIVISGDSAGAHIALTLARYLRDTKVLPMPKALLLFSPYSDMDVEGPQRPNKETDYLNLAALWFTVDLYLGRLDHKFQPAKQILDVRSPYASPCSARVPATPEIFKGFPSTVIHYGSAERLVRDAQELEKRLAIANVKVETVCWTDAPHDGFVLNDGWKTKEERHDQWLKVTEALQKVV